MKILCVIPSRISSTRLPRKPLLPIQGKPMIQWTFENAARCSAISKLIVATDSDEIAQVVHSIGGEVHMTDPHLQTGSDRVAAVAEQYSDMDIVINLQGDEPFIKPRMLESLIAPYLAGETPAMTTIAYPLASSEEFHDPGVVKVIIDQAGYALYFSRSAIPYYRQADVVAPVYHHMGLYAFRRDFLLQFTQLQQTPLELTEALEQLRAIEHGYKIKVCLVDDKTLEINTPEELARAQHFNYASD